MTDAAKSGASCKVLLGEVVAADTSRMGRERCNFDLLGRHPMAVIARDFGVLFSPVIEGRALASGLQAAGLTASGLRSLEIGQRWFFRVRRQPEIGTSHQQTRQSEYALLYSRHRQVYPPNPSGPFRARSI